MDPEIKKLLDGIRADIGSHNTEFQKRVDDLVNKFEAREADVKTLREQLEETVRLAKERDQQIKDMQQKMRTERLAADPQRDRSEAMRIFGMGLRAALARFFGVDVPQRYRTERDVLKSYHERMGRATLEESTGSGAILVPTILENEMIIDTLEEVQQTLTMADFLPGMPTKATIPTLTGRPSLQPKRASSDTAMTQSDATLGQLDIDTDEAYIFSPVDNWLLELAPAMIGNMMLPLLRDSILDAIDNWLWNADGTAGYNSLTGILQDQTAAYRSSLPAGKTSFADVTFPDIRDLIASVLARGRARGSIFCSDSVLGIMDDIERPYKRPLVMYPGDGSTAKICGKPVVIDEYLPDQADSAASKAFLGFGDLKTFVVALAGDGIVIDVSKEYLFGKNQTAFRGRVHLDIVRKPVRTFKTLWTAAA